MKRAALALLAVTVACPSSRPPLSLQPGEFTADDYDVVLDRWTRSDEIYEGLESKLFVHATFHSPEFRKAFLLRHKDVYGQGSEEARRLALTVPEADEQLEFFFSAFTTNIKWNDFDQEDSIWRATLTGDAGEPVDGRVVRLKPTANIRVIYPYISDFARTYAVRFPRTTASGEPVITSATERFVLRFVSALGEADLSWALTPIKPDPGA